MSNIPPPPGAPPPPPPGFGSTPPPPPGYPSAPPPPTAPPAYGAPPSYGAPALNYASWGQRVGATVIDSLISMIFAIPGFVLLLAGPSEIKWQDDGPSGPGLYEVPTAGTLALSVALFIGLGLVYLTIYCRQVGRTGQSWGKKATGYRTVDANTQQPVGAGKIFARQLLAFLNSLPCLLGFLWPLWDAEKRTFTDMIFNTRAVRA